MIDDAIRRALEGLSEAMEQLLGIGRGIITQTPAQLFGESFWATLLRVGTTAIVPFAVVIVAYCMALELYNVYCRANGDVDAQLVMTTVFKFMLPMLLIAGAYPLMEILYTMFNQLVVNIWTALQPEIPASGIDVDAYMVSISQLPWWSKLIECFSVWFAEKAMQVMSVIVFVVIYFRMFEIVIYWIIAPIPLATLVHHEQDQIGKNFLKLFMAVLLQGVLIILCLAMYTAMLISNVFEPTQLGLLQVMAFSGVLVFFMLKSGAMAKRILNTF